MLVASIHKEILFDTSPDTVWDAVRDVGAPHRRLTPGVLLDTVLDGAARVVTFANGVVVREVLVDVDDARRRFAYAVVDGVFAHHNASMQVIAEDDGCSRLIWITDLLPDDAVPAVSGLIEQGAAAMKRTLEH